MYTKSRIYMKKWLSALYLSGVTEISLQEKSLEEKVKEIEIYLKKNLPEKDFQVIEELFERSPVHESFDSFKNMLFDLNGEIIQLLPPHFETALIHFSSKKEAEKILFDCSILDIKEEIIQKAAEIFS